MIRTSIVPSALLAAAWSTAAVAAPADALTLRVDVSTEACQSTAFFKSVGGLHMDTEVVDYQEGGVNGGHLRPGRVRWGGVTLTSRAALAADACLQQWVAAPEMPAEVVVTLERPNDGQRPPEPVARWTMAALPSGLSGAGDCLVVERDVRSRRAPCLSALHLEVLDLQVSTPANPNAAPPALPPTPPHTLEVQVERADGTVEIDRGWRVSDGGEAFGRGAATGLVLRRPLGTAHGEGIAAWVDDTTHTDANDQAWIRDLRLVAHAADGRVVACAQGFPVRYEVTRLDTTNAAPAVEEVEIAGLVCGAR